VVSSVSIVVTAVVTPAVVTVAVITMAVVSVSSITISVLSSFGGLLDGDVLLSWHGNRRTEDGGKNSELAEQHFE
jgi:hypothetical protein